MYLVIYVKSTVAYFVSVMVFTFNIFLNPFKFIYTYFFYNIKRLIIQMYIPQWPRKHSVENTGGRSHKDGLVRLYMKRREENGRRKKTLMKAEAYDSDCIKCI